ncbi:MAG: hypothetical protein V1872_09715 [bacterium]
MNNNSNKNILKMLSLVLISLTLLSCGAFITKKANFIPSADYRQELPEEKPTERSIAIFSSIREVNISYNEIGIIETQQTGDGWTFEERKKSAEEKVIKAIVEKAKKVGADAVVKLEEDYKTYIPKFRFSSVPSDNEIGAKETQPKREDYRQVELYAKYSVIVWEKEEVEKTSCLLSFIGE